MDEMSPVFPNADSLNATRGCLLCAEADVYLHPLLTLIAASWLNNIGLEADKCSFHENNRNW